MQPLLPTAWLTPQLTVSLIAAALALLGALGMWWTERQRADPSRPLSWFSGPRLVALPLLGWLLGVSARMVRPYASWDGLHLEMLTALIILVTGTLALLISHTRHATRELRAHHRIFQLELATIWAAFATGWSLVAGRPWGDLIGFSAAWWFGSAVVTAIVFAVVRWRRPHPRITCR